MRRAGRRRKPGRRLASLRGIVIPWRGAEKGADMSQDRIQTFAGGCLCGAVRYAATAPLRLVVVCHCGQCRKWHGGPASYTAVDDARFQVTSGGDALAWFDSSAKARRGFCRRCGSSLFWKAHGRDYIAIAAGTLDGPTGLKTAKHLHVEDKADFYDLPADAASA